MNTVAKIMCLVTVAAFFAVGMFAPPDEKAHKNNEVSASGKDEIAYCVPEPVDVSSALRLAQTGSDPTYTNR